ncbi:MAG: hypothetical protein GEU90_14075 [Gemmatimonas sp.]|nr:hypothetical protein [Gemmatimonas sp.]
MNLKQMHARAQSTYRVRGFALGLAILVGAVGCDSLLDVELPSSVSGEALDDPGTAQLQLNAIMGQIECGLSAYQYHAAGYEDVFEMIAGAYGNYSQYAEAPGSLGEDEQCDPDISNFDWYDPMQIGRASANQLYDRIQNVWTPESVTNREQILAQTALYSAVALETFGGVFCEMTVDGGPLMTPDETLAAAEQWATTALEHIGATGDFELANGITGFDDEAGIEEFAHALRGRIRWARGNYAGASADIAMVPEGFTAWISREGRPERRNKVYFFSNPGSGRVLPALNTTFWSDPDAGFPGFFDPPAYAGGDWPNPIPFTGYLDLGIAPNGRALTAEATPYPVTTAATGAVADNRVPIRFQTVAAGGTVLYPVPNKYRSEGDDMPLVSWRELELIMAEIEPASAVGRVNNLRALHGLPQVTYGPATENEIENMIIEERRRELWLEGRYWVTKLQHTDKLWFPRDFGNWNISGIPLNGGVRIAMPESEYILNESLDLSDRGTMCDASQAPIIIG